MSKTNTVSQFVIFLILVCIIAFCIIPEIRNIFRNTAVFFGFFAYLQAKKMLK